MGEVIYGAFASRTKHTGGIRSPKQRTLLNPDLLWRHKGWAYQLPSTNLPARWEKEIAGVVVWAYILELKGRMDIMRLRGAQMRIQGAGKGIAEFFPNRANS